MISVGTTPIERVGNCRNENNNDADAAIVVGEEGECILGDSLDYEASSKNVANHEKSEVTNKSTSAQDLNAVNHKLLLEILARIRTIEEALMKNGTLNSAKNDIDKKNSFDEFHVFSKSNRLPLKNMEDLNTFEKNLNHQEFKNVAVRIYSKIAHSFYKVHCDLSNCVSFRYFFNRYRLYQIFLVWELVLREINRNF